MVTIPAEVPLIVIPVLIAEAIRRFDQRRNSATRPTPRRRDKWGYDDEE